ncbi:MAG: hypothetical protein R3240_09525 [Gammaproteobacteria bacterium]|nr:hypothetical protein [Gammaproteobacteria bacterium]
MKKPVFLLLVFIASNTVASEWPKELVQKTYDGCMRKGGKVQCECLVNRLQYKFTFEDIQRTRTDRNALKQLQRAVQIYNVKCLNGSFKQETQNLMRKQ